MLNKFKSSQILIVYHQKKPEQLLRFKERLRLRNTDLDQVNIIIFLFVQVPYVETSAKTRENVDKGIFNSIFSEYLL